ncbi:ABC transporter substrate-binding protein, partial [Pseudomonas aeruginosa]
ARAGLGMVGEVPLRMNRVILRFSAPASLSSALAAQMLQADLAKAGIQLTIRSLEWGELLKRSKAGEHDL